MTCFNSTFYQFPDSNVLRHDIRVIHETVTGTYTYSGSVSGKPGLPDNHCCNYIRTPGCYSKPQPPTSGCGNR
ncbi:MULTISPECIES: hypothetical protein [Niastella]|uniref:Uncharacterized protein n=1 Tax=Niastella soli TaxID=2821487 RepID=A0ABS3Z4X9_9BACT|nr:hypothetical protein [Niastella soli]MBO9204446.1 hypothetical protein [Niastella soli]